MFRSSKSDEKCLSDRKGPSLYFLWREKKSNFEKYFLKITFSLSDTAIQLFSDRLLNAFILCIEILKTHVDQGLDLYKPQGLDFPTLNFFH